MNKRIKRILASATALGAAALTSVPGAAPLAVAQVLRKAPPPCVADGTCIPNRGTWGYYQTNWHRWPGQAEAAAEPTPAGPTGDDENQLPPGPFVPEPIDEEQRGPNTPDSDVSAPVEITDDAGFPTSDPGTLIPAPGQGSGVLSPEVDEPGIDFNNGPIDPFDSSEYQPSGQDLPMATDRVQPAGAIEPTAVAPAEPVEPPTPTLQEVLRRQQEDAPPALPASLSQAAQRVPRQFQPEPTQAAPSSPRPAAGDLMQPSSLQVVGAGAAQRSPSRRVDPAVQQAAWAADGGIRVVGGDANASDQTARDGVQQAIYVEASDK